MNRMPKPQDAEAPYEIIPALAIIAVVIVLLLSGCAYRPIIDPKSASAPNYHQDLADCQRIADAEPGAGTGAAVGAGASYGIARGLSRTLGNTDGAATGRAAAILGLLAGASAGARYQADLVRNCMRGRGHNVLN